MLKFFKNGWNSKKSEENSSENSSLPILDLSLDEVKKAVSQFAREKPQGVLLSVLVKEDNQIDYNLLAPYLKGIPRKSYYMSRETYEIFEDQEFARTLDNIQQAVDAYIREKKEFPLVDFDPDMRISYYKLIPYGLIKRPDFDTFLTPDENLITWKKPVDR